ncbi:hypothetical protein [Burkholderia sp. GbtcB21]|uniref:hypothetical protein n=1 Tax=Burkholderia sp. GbtcB21 TaxID=2824766 RepID=UPI0034D64B1F
MLRVFLVERELRTVLQVLADARDGPRQRAGEADLDGFRVRGLRGHRDRADRADGQPNQPVTTIHDGCLLAVVEIAARVRIARPGMA